MGDRDVAALEALVERELKERQDRGLREVAALSAAHRLNGYDINVLRQWSEGGYVGRRPVLSFELQQEWEAEEKEQRCKQLQERMRAREHAAAIEAHKLDFARKLEEYQRWRERHPLKAEAIDALQAAKAREERRLAAARRAEQERLNQEHERRMQLLRRGEDKAGVLAMDEREFLEWCELVDVERLEAFTAELEADARRARTPPWLRFMQELAWEVAEGYREG